MKKIGVIFSLFLAFFSMTSIALAACETTERNNLNKLAVNVKASYEVTKQKIENSEGYNPPDGLTEEELANYVFEETVFKIYITNITEELYVSVYDSSTKETKNYYYKDTNNGTLTFTDPISDEIKKYNITIYSSDKTNCPTTKLHTLSLITPMHNSLATLSMCTGVEEFYLCHEYISVKTNFENAHEKIEKYRAGKLNSDGTEKKENKKEKGFLGFLKEHKGTVIITSIIIIGMGGLVTVIIVKKQRSRII